MKSAERMKYFRPSVFSRLDEEKRRLREEGVSGDDAMDRVRAWFREEVDRRAELGKTCGTQMDNAFRFLEETFGQGQELVIFVTEITAGQDTSWFVENFGCDAYFRHNRELLFDDTRRRIREEIAAARADETKEDGDHA